MSKKYRNDVSKNYKICKILNNIFNICFLTSVILSVILLYDYSSVICNILITIYVFSFFCNIINNILIDVAETENRKVNLSNAYNISLSEKKTIGYFNNNEDFGEQKLFINTFESVYFTKNILNKDVIKQTIITLIELITWFCLLLFIKNKNFVLLITQSIFSSEIIENYIKYIYYVIKVNSIYDSFHKLLITSKYSMENNPLLLSYCFDYESIKSSSRILINSKKFIKYNDYWSKEWSKIRKKIKKR